MSTDALSKPSTHPWGAFLHARAIALRWLRDEMKETPEKIAQTMSMDPGQVRLILMHVDANPDEYAGSPLAGTDGETK